MSSARAAASKPPSAPASKPAAGSKAAAGKSSAKPSANAGTHIPAPNAYILAMFARNNPLTHRRTPLVSSADAHATNLQRLVHHEGNRPPNRKILQRLRLLTFYPPLPDLLPDLVILLSSANLHIVRLAHYHIRACAPIHDPALYREIVEALEAQVISPSPARRAAATKTLARIFQPSDASRATDFVVDVFNCIGGARVKAPEQPSKNLIGLDKRKKKDEGTSKKRLKDRLDLSVFSTKVVSVEAYDPRKEENTDRRAASADDGAGGDLQTVRANAEYVRSKFGKKLVGHSVFAALRRINRLSSGNTRVEAFLIDSGLMSIVPSTVRHTVALLELRSTASATAVSRYLVGRLPHRNPPPHKRLHLQDLGARVYFARLLSALAEDPNLSAFIPDEAPIQKSRQDGTQNQLLKTAMAAPTVKAKASGLFKFLFNKERVSQVVDGVKSSVSVVTASRRNNRLKRDDPLGVEFAEALINLLKNASNRVLIEALRGLSRRRWTTWFEAPIPQGALYNSPELTDGEAYGGTADAWGFDDDDEDDEREDDEEELGAYDDDLAGVEDESKPDSQLDVQNEVADPGLDELGNAASKKGFFSRLDVTRKQRREERIDKKTPFYLRTVGHGMVPALEVILRRLYGALLHDEPTRRFAAADAVVVLARAKIYGHTEEDHSKLRKAQTSVASISTRSSSRALVPAGEGHSVSLYNGTSFDEEKQPFQALVRPLAELVHEDPNRFVRGRAAVALLFVIASGAGRTVLEPEEHDLDVTEEALAKTSKLHETPLLVRYFKSFVTHESAGKGIGLKLMSELVDYLIYEVLDVAPELGPSAVELTELWATTHPTVGVCGRLGALWEKVLSIGQGEVVGKSIFRAADATPRTERVASAAVIFLRRRTLDLAIITVGSSEVGGVALPEPLPRSVGVEMEKYFSLLWHTALLGASAECRTFAVEALGGAAVLAGEPFRCCTYERLVELVRVRGFGLKIGAEHVLNCLDMLYFARERFSEGRAKNKVARDGTNRSKQWLEFVWRLAAEASAAAQILLGVPPPTGWQPLGPAGVSDLANAEMRFGDVRDRQDNEKLKDGTITIESAPENIPTLTLEATQTQDEGSKRGDTGEGDDGGQLMLGHDERWNGSGPDRSLDAAEGRSRVDDGYYSSRRRRSSGGDDWREEAMAREEYMSEERRARDGGSGSRQEPTGRRVSEREREREREPEPERDRDRKRQEVEDYELAKRLQQGAGISGRPGPGPGPGPGQGQGQGQGLGLGGLGSEDGKMRDVAKDVLDRASGMADKLMKGGTKLTTKMMASKAMKGARRQE